LVTGMVDENTTFDSADSRSRSSRDTPEARKAKRVVVDGLERIGAQKGAVPAQNALAWRVDPRKYPWADDPLAR